MPIRIVPPFAVRLPTPLLGVLDEMVNHGLWGSKQEMVYDMIQSAYADFLETADDSIKSKFYEIEKAALEIDLRLMASRLIDISLFPWRGLMHGNQVLRHFRKHLGKKTFENCRIPLRVTGSNLTGPSDRPRRRLSFARAAARSSQTRSRYPRRHGLDERYSGASMPSR